MGEKNEMGSREVQCYPKNVPQSDQESPWETVFSINASYEIITSRYPNGLPGLCSISP